MRRITDEKARELAGANAPRTEKPPARERGRGRDFFISAAAASSLTLLFLLCFPKADTKTLPAPPPAPSAFLQRPSNPFGGGEIGMEELADHTALFLPTDRNYRKVSLDIPAPDGWEISEIKSGQFAAGLSDIKFAELEEDKALESDKNNLMLSSLIRAFSSAGIPPAKASSSPSKPAAIPNVKAVNLDTGETAAEFRIEGASAIPAIYTFAFSIYPDGSWRMPVTTVSSGDTKLDAQIASEFVRSEQTKRLPAGVYRITVSP
ncbi:MAG: hypothetical protein DBX55_10070 [Verrucomicrobia bacterium]|nr:MAG: hypothetical protein DBX55_10070 [Verrucomicrobiota bacterium]